MRLPGTELELSPLGLGGNVFGWTADRDAAFDLIDAFVSQGGNLLNSAANYSEWAEGNHGGESESIIGEWIAARRTRQSLVVCTKQGIPFGVEKGGFRAADMIRRTDLALRRLRTDYIDIVNLQCLPTQEPTDETFAAFESLISSGKVRYFGASNMSPEQVRSAAHRAAKRGAPRLRVLENHYSLLTRSKYEGELQAACKDHDVWSLPYWGLEKGFLTGKYVSGQVVDSPRAARYDPASYLNDRSLRILSVLSEIGAELAVSQAAVALLWLKQRPMVASVLASARNLNQLEHLLPVLTRNLSAAQAQMLTDASSSDEVPLSGAVTRDGPT